MGLPQDFCLHFIRTNLIYSLYSNFANKFYSNFAEQFDGLSDVLVLNNFGVLIFRKNLWIRRSITSDRPTSYIQVR